MIHKVVDQGSPAITSCRHAVSTYRTGRSWRVVPTTNKSKRVRGGAVVYPLMGSVLLSAGMNMPTDPQPRRTDPSPSVRRDLNGFNLLRCVAMI